jgi:fused signal recognition particle receptor
MFESLKKKLSSFFGKPKEEEKKKEIKQKTEKVKKSEKSKPKSEKKETEKPLKQKVIQEIKKVEEEIEVEEANKIQESKPKIQITDKPKEAIVEPEEEKQGFFSKLFKKIAPSGTITLEQKHVDEIFQEIEITLLENNVALEVVDKIKSNLSKDLVGIEVKKDKIESTILESLKNSILEVLIEPPNLFEEIKKSSSPYVILFFGINGSGKTTSIAKLAHKLKESGISCVLAAADTFRAASIEQLQTHAKKLQLPVVSSTYGADPASVAFDAIKFAEKNKIQCVLIDTAGRMYTKANLLREMEKIIRISKPNLKIFVGESITGNDMVTQCQTFNETVGIDGIVLTKSDIDEKGGAILSVSYITKKPIYCLGVGQDYKDLSPFTKYTVLKNIGLE